MAADEFCNTASLQDNSGGISLLISAILTFGFMGIVFVLIPTGKGCTPRKWVLCTKYSWLVKEEHSNYTSWKCKRKGLFHACQTPRYKSILVGLVGVNLCI